MRRMLHFLFPLLALVVCVARPSRADAPELAVCKDGHCVMAEADYRKLQGFVLELYAAAAQSRMEADRAQHITESCKAFLKDHHA